MKQSEQKLLKTKRNTVLNPSLYLMIIFFMLFIFSIEFFLPIDFELKDIFVNLLSFIFIFYFTRRIVLYKSVVFYTYRFEVKDYLGFREQIFFYKDISSLELGEIGGRKYPNKELSVCFYGGNKLKFWEIDYANFDEISDLFSSQTAEEKSKKSS